MFGNLLKKLLKNIKEGCDFIYAIIEEFLVDVKNRLNIYGGLRMNKKFYDVAMNDNSKCKWKEAICREGELYSRENDLRSEFGRDYTRIYIA